MKFLAFSALACIIATSIYAKPTGIDLIPGPSHLLPHGGIGPIHHKVPLVPHGLIVDKPLVNGPIGPHFHLDHPHKYVYPHHGGVFKGHLGSPVHLAGHHGGFAHGAVLVPKVGGHLTKIGGPVPLVPIGHLGFGLEHGWGHKLH
ncbi:hypothetical protein WA026_009549 [Henosepilachna vigintioctopunctata]|uniref:Uncharacterized protein n=1 Tax=Henosepilachna vigintioctopunctata TaxID=420089 RepID=A0AAW1U4Y4_9CUCU